MRAIIRIVIFGTGLAMWGFVDTTAQAQNAPAPSRRPPARSVQELMLTQIDPAADALWAAVSTISNASGVHENQPRTDAEWASLRRSAQALIAASDALMVKGLPVVIAGEPPPKPADDEETPSDVALSQDIQKAIDKNPALFARHALRLRQTAVSALGAIDRRDPKALFDLGEDIDRACEQCHRKYWYPDAK
jgi:hypothetical protein